MRDELPQPVLSRWLPSHVAAISSDPGQTIPRIDPETLQPILPGIDLWDLWPLQLDDGSSACFDGWNVWFVLSAPALPDPESRHGVARIRLMTERQGEWRDCGNALPDGLNPGAREWAGSALFDAGSATVTLFYTVAGYPGETTTSFAQRFFQTSGRLDIVDGEARITNWETPTESVAADGVHYVIVNQTEGIPGFIKGFRDPAHFRDPANGATYLLFTGSLKVSASDWNGCIGIARADDGSLTRWTLLAPLMSADGLNNEQERPHIVYRDDKYYLFWSTQRKVFAPGGPSGPNGLYGMVADQLGGPYCPLNGTGLVAANPEDAPFQAYSWWVTADLEVWGFADLVDVAQGEAVDTAEWRRAHFGGTPAPRFHIALDGERAWVDKR